MRRGLLVAMAALLLAACGPGEPLRIGFIAELTGTGAVSASDLAHTLSTAFGAPLLDLDAIDVNALTTTERRWLNEYHAAVYETVAPHLTEDERVWLRDVTRAI